MKTLIVYTIAAIILALPGSDLMRIHRNTLHDTGAWESQKVLLERGVMGAAAFMLTQRPLISNALDLGTWHGYQEVLTKAAREIRDISFRVAVPDGAYTDVLIVSADGTRYGVRLSKSPMYQSGYMTVATDGRFESKRRVRMPPLARDTQVAIGIRSPHIYLSVDGESPAALEARITQPIRFGFRGSLAGGTIDNIVARSTDGGIVFRDDFSNGRKFLLTAAFLMPSTLLAMVVADRSFRALRVPKPGTVTMYLWFVALLSLSGSHLYYSRQWGNYPTDSGSIDWRPYKNTIEDESTVVGRTLGAYTQRRSSAHRVLVIGTSQTWGAGASSAENSMTERLELLLNARGGGAEVINAGVSGSNVSRLYDLFTTQWHMLNPDVLVISLGNNDVTPDLREYIPKFVKESERKNMAVVLVGEANSPENPSIEHVRQNNAYLRAYAGEHRIPYVPLHDILQRFRESGYVWWDHVHLTDYGQWLAANALYGVVAPIYGLAVNDP